MSRLRTLLPTHPTTGLTALALRPDGRPIWPILGGSGDGDPGDGDGDTGQNGGDVAGDGTSGGDANGDGKGKPGTGEPTPAERLSQAEADVEKWKAQSRRHEERAKANSAAARELDELKRSQMNDQEKAVQTARDETRTEVLREVGSKLVDAKIEAASTGRLSDEQRKALLENLDRGRFLTDDGDVDTDKVTAFVDSIAPANGQGTSTPPANNGLNDMGQGRRGGNTTPSVATGAERYAQRHGSKTTA